MPLPPKNFDSPLVGDSCLPSCSPSSLTPETDANTYRASTLASADHIIPVVHADFARKLEREREEARFSAAYWRDIAAGSFAQAAVLPWESPENTLL